MKIKEITVHKSKKIQEKEFEPFSFSYGMTVESDKPEEAKAEAEKWVDKWIDEEEIRVVRRSGFECGTCGEKMRKSKKGEWYCPGYYNKSNKIHHPNESDKTVTDFV